MREDARLSRAGLLRKSFLSLNFEKNREVELVLVFSHDSSFIL